MVNAERTVSERLSESWTELTDCLRTINAWKPQPEYKRKRKMNGERTVNARWTICLENLEWYPPTITETRIHIDIFSIARLKIVCKNSYF